MGQEKEQFAQLLDIFIALEPMLLHCLQVDGTVTHQSINLPPPPPHTHTHKAKISMYSSRAFDWQALQNNVTPGFRKRKIKILLPFVFLTPSLSYFNSMMVCSFTIILMYHVQEFDIHIATFKARINSGSNNPPPPERCPPHTPCISNKRLL